MLREAKKARENCASEEKLKKAEASKYYCSKNEDPKTKFDF